MHNVADVVADAELLTRIFGEWPSFHDAEVLEMTLARGGEGLNVGGEGAPILTVKIYVFEMTAKVLSGGYFAQRHHTVVTLCFEEVDSLELDGFNHQNAIDSLEIAPAPLEEDAGARLTVSIEPSYGVGASFTCRRARVVAAEPCPAPIR